MFNLVDQVLPQDLMTAIREYQRLKLCLFLANRCALAGNFEAMDIALMDAQASRHELDKLMQYKKDRDLVKPFLSEKVIGLYEKQMKLRR